ncbi:MAG TPA: hypothetical protein DCY79_16840 [Planctomycetaceae bacterium]|nr:hypothetical protein [Planctomycetaceae bacterium]
MANQPNGKIHPGRWKGMKAAVADLDKGVLQLNEYPPLPSPPFHSAYTWLLQTECGVGWQLVKSPKYSEALRGSVAGYHDVMRAEIEYRFGRDILTQLRSRAQGK